MTIPYHTYIASKGRCARNSQRDREESQGSVRFVACGPRTPREHQKHWIRLWRDAKHLLYAWMGTRYFQIHRKCSRCLPECGYLYVHRSKIPRTSLTDCVHSVRTIQKIIPGEDPTEIKPIHKYYGITIN